MSLPPPAVARIDAIMERAGLTGGMARELREDLEAHVAEGLAAGRPLEEVLARLGEPDVVGPRLARIGGNRRRASSGSRPTAGASGGPLVGTRRDVRLAARMLTRAPGVAATAILVLALGIGANTVVFTVLNELLLRPLPVDDPATLVDVWADIQGGNSFTGFSYQDAVTFREESETLADLVPFMGRRIRVGPSENPTEAAGQLVGHGYFELLGVGAAAGRTSLPADVPFGSDPMAVLSHGYWTESFGSDPGVVGRTLLVDGLSVDVIGVAEPGFSGHFIGFPVDLWLPITAADPLLPGFDPEDRSRKPFELIGRLRSGASVDMARVDLARIAERIEAIYPDDNRGHGVGLTPTTGLDHSLRPGVTAFVGILTAISLLVLLMACLNVGSVLLVRAMSRDREIAVRVAMGAGTDRIVRQLAVETLLLVGLGAVVGIGVSVPLNDFIGDTLSRLAPGIGLELALDRSVLMLTTIVAAAAAIVATVAPALHVARKHPADALRARSSSDRGSGRLRSVLVVGQVGLSVVLVVATGLFVRSLVEGVRADPGLDVDRLATFVVEDDRSLAPAERLARMDRVTEAIRALPEVEAVVLADAPPVGVGRTPTEVDIPGVEPPPGRRAVVLDGRVVGPGYLTALGVGLLAGRDVREADLDGPPVAIVSESFIRRFRPDSPAIGWTLTVAGRQAMVVGVATDARYVVQDAEPEPLVYLSRRRAEVSGPIHVTVRGEFPSGLGASVADVVMTSFPGARRPELRRVRETLDEALLPQRMGALLVGTMGLGALLLSTVGLYGLVHYTVSRDTHELGVRLALGGGRRDVVRVVLQKGFRLAAFGTAAGVLFALLAAPALRPFLGDVSPADPVTYVAVVACFAVVALVASWVPARRALSIDATEALRGGD